MMNNVKIITDQLPKNIKISFPKNRLKPEISQLTVVFVFQLIQRRSLKRMVMVKSDDQITLARLS